MMDKLLPEFADSEAIKRTRIALAAVFLLAVILRLYAMIHFPATQVADAADYHRLAINLATGHGYVAQDGSPTAWRPPGYPFFLAGVYSVVGGNVFVACLVQVIIGALTAVMVMYLGLEVLNRKAAIVSGVIAALYPGLIYLPRLLLSENLAVLLLLSSVLLAARVMRSDKLWLQVFLGSLLGFCALTRGANLIPAALLLGVVSLRKWRTDGPAGAFRGLFLMAAGMAIVLTPWAVRNYTVFHRFASLDRK